MDLETSACKNLRTKKTLTVICNIHVMGNLMQFQQFALHLVFGRTHKTLMSLTYSSMTKKAAHTNRFLGKVKPLSIPLFSYLWLRTTQNINGLDLPTCKIGWQMLY